MALDAKKLFPNTDIFIIPMRVDNCEPVTPEIKKLHWIDLFPKFNEGIRKALHSITYNEAKKESTTSIKPIRNTIKYKYNENKWIDRHIGIVTGNIRYILFSDAWVNSENIDFEMARPTEKSISAIIRYLGAVKNEDGKIINDVIYDELIKKKNKKHSPCDVIITNSGELLKTHGVKKIFHVAAVNSEFFSGYSQVENIENCISNILIKAEKCSVRDTSIKSILFPLLGTGVGHGELDETIEKLVRASAKFYDSHINSSIKEIYFIARNLEQLDASRRIFDKIFNA